MTIATVGHVACTWFLLARTSDDRCYCGTRGTRAVSTSPHNSDRLPDISGPLLLPHIVAMGYMTSDDHCYYWTCDTLVVHCYWTASSDGVAVRCYWTSSSDGLSSVIPSLLDCAVATA
jgi:hypothetical protein